MEEIVCRINHREPDSFCSRASFTVVEALLSLPLSAVRSFFNAVDRFDEEDFKRLNNKIQQEREEFILLNEKEIVVYYSVLYFASVSVSSNAESQWLLPYYAGRESQFETLREQVLRRAPQIGRELYEQFRHLPDFAEVYKMIPLG